jgi:DNA-binding NarL/FixJ family response regulator
LPDSLPHRALLHSRGQLRLIAGDTQRALDDFDEFDRREAAWATINPWLNNHRHGATLARARLGRADEARERARAALQAAKRWGTHHAVGRALVALGTTSPADEADAHLSGAVAILAASPARLDHAAALVELGAVRRRSGARKAAETALREGLDLAARLGAGLLVERARGELVAMGRRPRRTAITGVDALTGSERRVADLAAAGMTNRDIAQSLFVTTRTVEIHLSAAYRKLGIDSRSRLGDALSPPS